jgi:hypothetical protein
MHIEIKFNLSEECLVIRKRDYWLNVIVFVAVALLTGLLIGAELSSRENHSVIGAGTPVTHADYYIGGSK